MAFYIIAEAKIIDQEIFSQGAKEFDKVLKKCGGRFLVRGGKITSLSGNWNPERILVIEFDTFEQLTACLTSREYLEIGLLREQATIYKAIVSEGYQPTEE